MRRVCLMLVDIMYHSQMQYSNSSLNVSMGKNNKDFEIDMRLLNLITRLEKRL